MILERAREVLRIEAEGILGLVDRLGRAFEEAVEAILHTKGRVIVTGMGKSGLVGRKIAATLNSTGTGSLFLHPAEAIHGDLGMVTANDVVLAISNSGKTPEVIRILPMLRDMGAKIIGFVGNRNSPMARQCDIVIDVAVEREACPLGLAPTTSTTAALAMGDALAVALIVKRRFKRKDFRRFHPGGNLGERLSLKVREVMLTGERVPVVRMGTSVREALHEMDAKGVGATLVVSPEGRVEGIVTDGDLRRALLKGELLHELEVEKIMSPSPKSIDEEQSAMEALALMELHEITHLVIVDGGRRLRGLVHLHDLLGRRTFGIEESLGTAAGTHC